MKDSLTRHQIFIQRTASPTRDDIMQFTERLLTQVDAILKKDYNTVMTKKRYQTIFTQITQLTNSLKKDLENGIKITAEELAQYELQYINKLMTQATVQGFTPDVPSLKQVIVAAKGDVAGKVIAASSTGALKTIGDGLNTFTKRQRKIVTQSIRDGYANGDTVPTIIKSMGDILNSKRERQYATSLSRTIVNKLAADTRQAFYEENDDVITGYQWIATLESNTCEECAALDGVMFDKDDFTPPPVHYNCRCSYIAMIDPALKVTTSSTRPAKSEDGVEQVSGNTTYNSWLRSQSAAFQDEVLGKTKGEMFRNGYSVKDFVDDNYKPYTVDELRRADERY